MMNCSRKGDACQVNTHKIDAGRLHRELEEEDSTSTTKRKDEAKKQQPGCQGIIVGLETFFQWWVASHFYAICFALKNVKSILEALRIVG